MSGTPGALEPPYPSNRHPCLHSLFHPPGADQWGEPIVERRRRDPGTLGGLGFDEGQIPPQPGATLTLQALGDWRGSPGGHFAGLGKLFCCLPPFLTTGEEF